MNLICRCAPAACLLANLIFVGSFFALTGKSASAANGPAFLIRHWTVDNRLPQNTINCILQAQDGYLWVGTKSGLAKFDGVKFTPYDRELATSDMADRDCQQLVEDTETNLWIRTRTHLVRHRKGVFISYSFKEDFQTDKPSNICARRDGGLWVGTTNGPLLFQNGRITKRYEARPNAPIAPAEWLYEDRERMLWIRCHTYLQRLDQATGKVMSAHVVFGEQVYPARSLFQDRAGRYWVCGEKGLFWWENGGWRTFSQTEPLSRGWVNDIHCQDSHGDFWLGTYTETRRLHDGHSVRWGREQGLSDDDIRCVYEDREGNLWIGTGSAGLNQLVPRRLQTFTRTDGLAGEDIQSVCEARDGRLWLATDLSVAKHERFKALPRPIHSSFPESNNAQPLLEDRSGTLWFGLGKHGLFSWEDGQAVQQPLGFAGATNLHVTTLMEDRANTLWVGTDQGLFCRTNGQFVHYTTKDGLSLNLIAGLRDAPDGSLWIGTYGGGVNHFADGRFLVFTTNDGLLSNLAAPLHVEPDGTVWITTRKGLNRIKNGAIRAVTMQHGLFDNTAYAMLGDSRGNFWLNCDRGIYRVERQALHAVADGRQGRLNCIPYGTSDGMVSSESNGDVQPNACKTRDGKLWFPTTKGLVMIEPEKLADNEVAPPVVIEQVKADDEVIYGDGVTGRNPKMRLAPGRARVLEIRYTANSFVAPEKIRFKYQLEDHDKGWRDADSTERVAFYTNLRPGEYTFRVKACNNHGVWNETGDSFAFSLAPKFTQTIWFPLSCVVGLLTISGGLAMWRLRWQRRVLLAQQGAAVERERARIARDLHDDLGASLTGMALELEAAQSRGHAANEELATLAMEARSLANGLRELAWTTNPRCDNVASLGAFLGDLTERFCNAAGLECKLELPPADDSRAVPPRVRHDLLMVAKETLANIAKHANAREVSLQLAVNDGELRLTVRDDGIGFHPAQGSGGSGLQNLRERLEQASGSFAVESQPNKGTTITARLPLREAERP